MGISKSKKELLVKYVDNYCEKCKKQFPISELRIHRIRRGCSYSEYRSLMVLCNPCHQKIHKGEFL
ncbi:MAG: hypothetical protein WC758_07490 [Candidatus Woesearchaeota archaeon]|jgi:hypothetical protein